MLREISQVQEDKYCVISLTEKYLEWANSKRQIVNSVLTGAKEREASCFFNGHRVSIWDNEKVLKIDSDHGRTTLRM